MRDWREDLSVKTILPPLSGFAPRVSQGCTIGDPGNDEFFAKKSENSSPKNIMGP